MSIVADDELPSNIHRLRERKARCFRDDLQAAYRAGFDEGYLGVEPGGDFRGDLGLAYCSGGLDGCVASGTQIVVQVPFGCGLFRRVS